MYRSRTFVLLAVSFCLPRLSNAEHHNPYKLWVKRDVSYIITPAERAEYLRLSTDEQRDRFIVGFWARRDPIPGTPENEFKEEHYRRIAFANEHFAAATPGWETDRGRVYIVYGPPDRIESYPSPDSNHKLQESTAFTTSSDPNEVWHYHRMEGKGRDVKVRFVDACRCGEYRLEGLDNQDMPLTVPNIR